MKENKANPLTLVINSGGLNQIYLNPKEITVDYSELQSNFYSKLSALNIPKEGIDKIINDTLLNKPKENFDEVINLIEAQLSQSNKDQHGVKIRELFLMADYQTIDVKYVKELAGNYTIIVLVPNSICLFIESMILSHLKFFPHLSVKCLNDEVLLKEIRLNPKGYFVFDNDLTKLYQFCLIGTWTAYLTNYIKIQSKNDLVSSYHKMNTSNLDLIRSHGIFFNFSVFFFIQMINYCNIISDLSLTLPSNKSDDIALKKVLQTTKPINCLVIYRYLFKAGEIRRGHLFICNSKVNYISYIGSIGQDTYDDLLDLSINYKQHIDCFLGKFSEVQELNRFEKMIKSIDSYCDSHPQLYCINSLKRLSSFLIREKMLSFMKDFCLLDSVSKLTNGSVAFPLSYSVNIIDVYDYGQLTQYMKEKKLKLPLILKYTGPKLEYNHLLINVITEEGLKNYINFIQSFTKGDESKISVVMQSYINHGGYVIKLYRINHKSYIFYRPSFPDAKEELVSQHEEYKRGFYQTFTSALVTKEFNDFWSKLSHNSKVKEMVNEDYLNSLADIFENYSQNNLIGLDFLFDYESNVYYLIDVNCFPGYKEMIGEFNDHITSHVEYYFNQFKSK